MRRSSLDDMEQKMIDVFLKHPRPWRVTDEYRQWCRNGGFRQVPSPIVDANETDVLSVSEWLDLDEDVADTIVVAINNFNPNKEPPDDL